MYTVYLSGGTPQQHRDFIEGTDLRVLDFEDPHEISEAGNLLVQEQMARLRDADIMLAIINEGEMYFSTPMEMVYAKAHDLPVVVVFGAYGDVPIWLDYHADALVRSTGEAREAITELL